MQALQNGSQHAQAP